MNYHTHLLNSQNYSHIIGRQDAVTGDIIKANDEVVFCSACQSVFLVESWEYMNREHCNQTQTLDFVPTPIPVLIAKKKVRGKNNDDKLIFEFGNSNIEFLRLLFIIPVISFLVGITLNHWVAGLFILAGILSYISSLIIIYSKSIKENKLIRKIFKIHKNTVKVLEKEIELQNEKFYSYYEIQKIQYINKSTWDFLVDLSEKYIVIYLKNGEVITQKLPSKRYEQTKPFLFALAWAAQFTELHFYTEVQQELGLVKSIERNYTGKILVLN